MAHFAKLDNNNIVQQVIVINNNILLENNVENEQKGIKYCKYLFGQETIWVQTSYNNNFRKNYAGIGYQYDPNRDAFIPPKPYPSWTFNELTLDWDPPVENSCIDLENQKIPVWDEDSLSWIYV